MSVKVGVRVRPYNQRQMDLNCKLCVDMMGNMTRLFDAQDPSKHRDFTFDYSFWSHDEFTTQQDGYFKGDGDKYADQAHVFEQVGLQILSNAWDGYHCCLFAYGQTGAGKSYSMVGYGANKGIVPISCQEIFKRIQKNDNKEKEYEVNLSMMEIYNERVQDLLIPISKRPKQGHKIRQHPTLGIYVEGMSKHFVDTYESIEKKMQEGGRNRSIGATEMNATSSRAHTIISIEFKQIQIVSNKKRQKMSVIHLVDLAGSEKVGKTGAVGDRLKEAAGINKSLSVLGLVISTLADKSMGKKGVQVPYRDSCLTRILQNALGGNSKTLMICAISPASDNYQETLSTLRYADQAKKIQNKAIVNESETDKLIRQLNTEKDELRSIVQQLEDKLKMFQSGQGGKLRQQYDEIQQQLRYNNEVMTDKTTSKSDKKKIEQEQEQNYARNKIDSSKPHLSNLNQDPQLSRKINYSISDSEAKVGRRNIEPQNDIEIGGMGIRQLHALIINLEDEIIIEPVDFQGEDSGCYLNGNPILVKQKLYHLDRLSFGTNNMFLVVIPETNPREEIKENKIDWDYAQEQLYMKKQQMQQKLLEEKTEKINQENQEKLREKQEALAALQKSLQESIIEREKAKTQHIQSKQKQRIQIERKVRQEQAKALQSEIRSKKKKMQDGAAQQKQITKQKYYFERKLLKTLPKCIELNLIAKQFKKNVSMSVKMMLSNEQEQEDLEMKKRSIMIKVVNKEVGYTYWWDVDTLSNRYYIIKDMSQTYFQTGVTPTLDEKNDPFWDPPQPTLIGRGFLTTKALAYMFDNPATLPIIGQDEHCGEIVINLIPTDQTGTRNLCEEMDDEEAEFQPQELLDKPFHFLILVQSAKIPMNYKDIYVEYTLKINQFGKETFKTEEIKEITNVPVFDYKKLHSFSLITEPLLNYITTSKLVFKIYGCEMIEIEKKQKQKTTQPQKKPSIVPDIEKAKKQDLKKNEDKKKTDTPKKTQTIKKTETKIPSVNTKTPPPVSTTKSNNKIGSRDQTNAKQKDCEIY